MKFPYPNTSQWIVIWLAAILVFTEGDWHFFTALGEYGDHANWLWPEQVLGSPRDRLHAFRLLVVFVLPAVLLVWQFARPVSLRSPILIPVTFVLLCVCCYATLALRRWLPAPTAPVVTVSPNHEPVDLDKLLQDAPAAKK